MNVNIKRRLDVSFRIACIIPSIKRKRMTVKEAISNYIDIEAISAVPFFRGMKSEVLNSFLEYSIVKKLPKGEYLFMADEICSHLYIIREGLLELFLLGEGGKRIILHHATNGALLGDTLLFNKGIYGAYAHALEDSQLFAIEKKSFEDLVRIYPEIGIRIVSDFGNRIERLKLLVAEISFTDVRKRILRMLLEILRSAKEGCTSRVFIDNRNSIILTNVPTQDEMAYRVGTVREVLCKGLHKLEKDNLISVKRGNIIIKDINRLREMFSADEGNDNLFPMILPIKGT